MTVKERKELLYDYYMKYWCTDDEDNRKTALAWNAAISDEAKKLHEECIIIDGCAFNLETYNWQLQAAKPTALNMTIPQVYDPSASSIQHRLTDVLHAIVHDSEHFMAILKASDIEEAKKTDRVGLIMGAQTCDFVRNSDIEAMVYILQRVGFRVMQLAYHTRSFAADGCDTDTDAGITKHGKTMIRAMQKYGITVDLAHVGRRSTLEAMDMAEKPMVFSHTNSYKLFPGIRTITDEQAKKCAATGGLVGVCGFPQLIDDGKSFPTIERYIDTIKYFVDLIGIDHVGIGLDSNAEPGGYMHRNARNMGESYFGSAAPEETMFDIGFKEGRGKASVYVDGLYGLANFPNVVDKLLKGGFNHEEVKKIMGENFLRVFEETWAK